MHAAAGAGGVAATGPVNPADEPEALALAALRGSAGVPPPQQQGQT